MRTKAVSLLTALLLLLPAAAQTLKPDPKPAEEKKPSQLEELLAQALRDNPDVRVAEAKLREAEAELNRVRLQTIQKVVGLQSAADNAGHTVVAAEAALAAYRAQQQLAEKELERMNRSRAGVAAQEHDAARLRLEEAKRFVAASQAQLQAVKAEAAKGEADLHYLLGRKLATRGAPTLGDIPFGGRVFLADEFGGRVDWKVSVKVEGDVADKLRSKLRNPINLHLEQTPLAEVLDSLKEFAGVPFVESLPRELKGTKTVTLKLTNVSLGVAFQAVEDAAGVQFGVREYGVLVSDRLPAGVLTLHDFRKADGAKTPR